MHSSCLYQWISACTTSECMGAHPGRIASRRDEGHSGGRQRQVIFQKCEHRQPRQAQQALHQVHCSGAAAW